MVTQRRTGRAAGLFWRGVRAIILKAMPVCRRGGMVVSPIARVSGKVLVIAHRGASALLPEHTLAAYARAIEDGADLIEPDLVMTRDGVLVARHEGEISASTDVSSRAEFHARRTSKLIDGALVEGWFCEDFTLAELRTLRCREPLPDMRSRAHDGLHAIPTFDEIVELAARESQRRGRMIGIIPEIKNSTWFHSIDLDPERALIAAVQRHDYLRHAPFGIQSFEVGNLRELRSSLGSFANIFLVQLIGSDDAAPFDQVTAGSEPQPYTTMIAPSGLAAVREYADAVAVNRRRIRPLDPVSGGLAAETTIIADAHAAGLAVHAWTLRPENAWLPPAWRCGDDPAKRCESGFLREMRALIDAGVDAIFSDDPGLARRAVDAVID